MSPRSLVILVVLGVVAIAGGWYFGIDTLPTQQRSTDAGKLMFPDLAARLQQATRIEVVHQGNPMVIEKRTTAGQVRWGLADRGGYPVQETKLRAMLTALTELRLVEQRTADPAQFATLGVEDPNGKASNANLLRVLDASGKPLLALIVGHRRVRTGGNVPEEVYVRRPDDNQSWLAEGSVDVDSDPQLWLDRDIMNIDHGRIAKVVVSHGDARLDFARVNDKLTLATPAEHAKLDDYKLEDVSRALELLTFEDVQPDTVQPSAGAAQPSVVQPGAVQAGAVQPPAPIGQSVFATSDGLTVTATLYRAPPPGTTAKPDSAAGPDADRAVLARFTVTGDGKAKPEADRLQARLAGWTYQLGAWKQKSLAPALADLLAAPDQPAAAAPGAAGPGAVGSGAAAGPAAPGAAAGSGAAAGPAAAAGPGAPSGPAAASGPAATESTASPAAALTTPSTASAPTSAASAPPSAVAPLSSGGSAAPVPPAAPTGSSTTATSAGANATGSGAPQSAPGKSAPGKSGSTGSGSTGSGVRAKP